MNIICQEIGKSLEMEFYINKKSPMKIGYWCFANRHHEFTML